MPNHKGEPVVTSADETPSYSINTRYHTANIVFEYKLGKFGVFAPFVGIGGGAQYRHATMSHSIYAHNYWSADHSRLSAPERLIIISPSAGRFSKYPK